MSSSSAEAPPSALDADQQHAHKTRFRTMTFPRKRAVTACESCRVRKTKCDNRRPRCATCEKSGLNCSYDPRLDHSSFDPASLLILEKLNEVSQKIDGLGSPVVQQQRQGPSVEIGPTIASPPRVQRLDLAGSDACLEVFSAHASTDCILTWPIFDGRWPPDLLSRELYNKSFGSSQSSHIEEAELPARKRQKLAINEEEVPELIDRYLHYVYPKNPIFYMPRIRELARHISEDGFGWDASSCLVLLACALGAISSPYIPAYETGQLHGKNSTDEAAQRRRTAETYFVAARKRMGLLEPSLIASQCHMLSGIYYMYTLRQLQGWSSFNQAGSSLALYLKGQAALEAHYRGQGPDSPDKRLEQRLYWTVLKSECEMRTEIDLPQSDLCKVEYPYPFPSPPSPRIPAQTPQLPVYTPTPPSTTGTSSYYPVTPSYQAIEEQSWFYYLSEIALRRIENRVLNTFYKDDHHSWTRTNVQDMISAALAIEEQLEGWISSAPDSIRYDNLASEKDLDELRYATEGRERGIRGLLYRPFLYHALHATQTPDPNTQGILGCFLDKAIESCLYFNSGLCMTHRHHGTWYSLRWATTGCLMLVAAHMKGLISWTTPSGDGGAACENKYGRAMQICIEKLQYWEAESPDIVRAREMMQELTASS